MSDPAVDPTPSVEESGGIFARIANIRMGKRLFSAFGIVLALTIAVSALGFQSLKKLDNQYSDAFAYAMDHMEEIAVLNGTMNGARADLLHYVLTNDAKALDKFKNDRAEFVAAHKHLVDTTTSAEGKKHLATIETKYAALVKAWDDALAAKKTRGNQAAVAVLNDEVAPARTAVRDSLAEFTKFKVAQQNAQNDATSASANQTAMTLVGIAALAVLIGIGLAWIITRSVVAPLQRLTDATAKAADGDLTVAVNNPAKDELGDVSRSFDGMMGAFRDVVRRVTDAAASQNRMAREMADAAQQSGEAVGQIAATVEDVARGAGQQAESTQQTTDTMEEMTTGVQQVAQGGEAAATAAQEADQAASEGAALVGEANQAMERISHRVDDASAVVTGLGDKSQAIGEIVQTINEIASQTNLLALNAAIEAARAGEQGRGFAVVAEEVRKLAEESQGAVASIGEIIRDIQQETSRAVQAMEEGREEVHQGVGQVARAGEAFTSIRERVEVVAGEVTQVAAAAQQLSAGADSVREQVMGIAAISQQNAAAAQEVSASTEETSASTEEVAASASSMATEADRLAQMVAHFTV